MIIDNNIGGSAQQSRSQNVERRQAEPVAVEATQTMPSGGKISFVNALEATSLANVLWTVSNEAVAAPTSIQTAGEPISQLESTWFGQAYTEH